MHIGVCQLVSISVGQYPRSPSPGADRMYRMDRIDVMFFSDAIYDRGGCLGCQGGV